MRALARWLSDGQRRRVAHGVSTELSSRLLVYKANVNSVGYCSIVCDAAELHL